jgi:uncharacterized membrane protein YbjE (DUF340 family)
MPFLCLGVGFLFGIRQLSDYILKTVDLVINVALIILMLTIGMNIGINDSVILNLKTIGLNCIAISLSAITFSVLLVLLIEKTILPLGKLKERLYLENLDINNEINIEKEEQKKSSVMIWIIPFSIISGILIGYFILSNNIKYLLDYFLIFSLVFLYMGVGINLGVNRKVFKYIKLIGLKVAFIPLAIFIGSLIGGLLSGLVLDIPVNISVISASGMSYYSITGAYMTQVYGIEAGTYGFMVNVMREFLTVLLLPFLVKISNGSPIAGGAAGNMDTMLVPVTKFVGAELGLVALITGVILTFAVPFILPILYGIL